MPIYIDPGYPEALETIMLPYDDDEFLRSLRQHRKSLENVIDGCSALIRLHGRLCQEEILRHPLSENISSFHATHDCAKKLLDILRKYNPLTHILSVNEDILGIYQYELSNDYHSLHEAKAIDIQRYVNPAIIRLYWGVIGLVSDLAGFDVEDLTIVVMCHELAHAYTQLGADIEGRRWPASAFAKTDTYVKEGLAQYYTKRVLKRLSERYPNGIKTFKALLKDQPDPYKAHDFWIKEGYRPEVIRRAMLEVRRLEENATLEIFEKRLAEAKQYLER